MSKHTTKCVDIVVRKISEQLADGKSWALEQFILKNPDIGMNCLEIVELPGNPFGYFIRVLVAEPFVPGRIERAQLWEPCESCGKEPCYTPNHLCGECDDD